MKFITIILLIGFVLLSISAYLQNDHIGMLITISDKQSKWIENLQARVFILETDIAITDLGYADRDTSYLIPGRGIPDAYWHMYLFEQIGDLPMGDSTLLGPIWEQAVKDYWGEK